MAIELVPQLQTGAPSAGSADWDKMIGLVSANEVPDLSFLTGWELTSGIPAIKQGVYIYHAGATYRVNNNDEVISGTPTSGLNYIEATVAAGVMTLAWVQSLSGYSYNAAYAGIYNAGDVNQLLNDVLYIDGVSNYRGRSMGMDFDSFYIAGGAIFYTGGLNTLGNNINTGGGNIETEGGNIDLGGGNIVGDNFIYVSNGRVENKFTFASNDRKGVTYDGANLISCRGTASSTVFIHSGITSVESSSFAAPSGLADIATDGTNLLSCSAVSDLFYLHSGFTSSITSSFSMVNPNCITYDGANLISNISGSTIRVHSGITSTISNSFTGAITPTAMTFDGEYIVLLNSTEIALHETDGTLIYYGTGVFTGINGAEYIDGYLRFSTETTTEKRGRNLVG